MCRCAWWGKYNGEKVNAKEVLKSFAINWQWVFVGIKKGPGKNKINALAILQRRLSNIGCQWIKDNLEEIANIQCKWVWD